jgi:hypothetical protein
MGEEELAVVPDYFLLNRGEVRRPCTLETGIFWLISEGQLMVQIRPIVSKNKNFLQTFFAWTFQVAN